MSAIWQIVRIVAVIALLCVAAAVATPRGRLPLALRGVRRILRQDFGEPPAGEGERVSVGRRIAAFLLVLAAVLLAAI